MKHPRETLSVIGHTRALDDLQAKWQGGTLPHALLFMGPRGIGKATLAYHIAYHIFKGTSGKWDQIASDDPLYRRILAQSHGDLLVLERIKDSEGKIPRDITVDEARRVTELLKKTSLEGGWRIVLIDSVDEMNRQAMNAILKGLEEPPARCLFLLTSHQPGRLLPTVLSRCHRITCSPLANVELLQILKQQGFKLQESETDFILDMAEGSVGRALRLLSLEGAQLYKKITHTIEELMQGRWDACQSLIKENLPSAKNPSNQERYMLIGELLGYWLSKQAHAGALQQRPLDQWTQIWEKTQMLFRESERLSLDPFQVLIHAFGLLVPDMHQKK